jgi:hypothetical protein
MAREKVNDIQGENILDFATVLHRNVKVFTYKRQKTKNK